MTNIQYLTEVRVERTSNCAERRPLRR